MRVLTMHVLTSIDILRSLAGALRRFTHACKRVTFEDLVCACDGGAGLCMCIMYAYVPHVYTCVIMLGNGGKVGWGEDQCRP